MNRRPIMWAAMGIPLLFAAGFSGWLLTLPSAPAYADVPPVAQSETNAMIASLKPPKRARPLIAVVGINEGTEVADYLMTTGILRRADIADVTMLSTERGPVKLYPALQVEADATIAEFDSRNPRGADYVIVPAMEPDDDPKVIAWLQGQARKGAIIVSVCVGAKVIGVAGLLDHRHATTHWYYVRELLDRTPSIAYVPNRRMVVDRGVATTTGITASMPMMLTLIEAIGGHSKAEAVARDLGAKTWDARHDSSAFKLNRSFATTVLRNRFSFWNHETLGINLQPGADEVSLALIADAWSRTYESKAFTFANSKGAVLTRGGVRVIPDERSANAHRSATVSIYPDRKPVDALQQTLGAMADRYGSSTANMVAMQLEYPGRAWRQEFEHMAGWSAKPDSQGAKLARR